MRKDIGVRPVPGVLLALPTLLLPTLPAANGLEYALRSKTLAPRAIDFPSLCAAGDMVASRAAGVIVNGVLERFAFRCPAGVPPRAEADMALFFRFISLKIFSCIMSLFVGAGMANIGPELGVLATASLASNLNGVPSINPQVITGS